MFEAYLEQYPDGEFARIAKLKFEAATKAKEQQTALVVPPKPEIEIDPIEAEYVAVKNANVRKLPTVDSDQVALLEAGTRVQVAGKVKDRNWYLVEREDKPLGYVYGELLKEPEAAKLPWRCRHCALPSKSEFMPKLKRIYAGDFWWPFGR